MDIHPEDETSHTAIYQEAFSKHVESEYWAKHQHVPVNEHESLQSSTLVLFAMASGSCRTSFDPYDLSSDDEVY